MKALVVGADAATAHRLEEALREAGHDADVAPDAETAWEAFLREGHPIVLVGIQGPGGGAAEFIRRLRSVPEGESCGILGFGQPRAAEMRKVLEAGLNGWLNPADDVGALALRLRIAERCALERIERVRAGRALQDSEERYRSLIENSQIGLYRTTPDGRILLANGALVRMLGYSSFEELSSRNLEKDGFEPGYPREDFKRILDRDGHVAGLEAAWKRRDGTVLTVRESARAVRDADGKTLFYEGTVEDVSERSLVEEALRQSEGNYRALVERSPLGILIAAGLPPRVLFVNRSLAEWMGHTPEEIRTLKTEDLLALADPEDREVFFRRYVEALRSGLVLSQVQLRLRRPEGGTRWLEVYSGPIEIGGESAVQALFLDATDRILAEQERRKLESQLLQSQKMESLGVLTGGIAHDFNNILMGVLGYADLALMEVSPESPAHPHLGEIKKAARRLADLTRQMLAYSGKTRLSAETLDLSRLVEDMAAFLRVSIPKNVEVRYRFAPGLPAIRGDATQLRQVVMNLLTNAAEAIGEAPGAIAISTEAIRADRKDFASAYLDEGLPAGPYVALEVRDTGCGMDENVKARIFEPFFTTKFAGRGLGLSAVLGIVRGHKGAVQVSSEPERGTTFRILFPALEHPAPETPTPAVQGSAWRGSGTVLVVDDEPAIRSVAGRMLRKWGFEVLDAADGAEAVDVFRRRKDEIVLLLLDLTMPRMDGLAAFRAMRAIRAGVPALLFSGYSEQDTSRKYEGEGFAGFVQKPYDFETLLRAVREVLNKPR